MQIKKEDLKIGMSVKIVKRNLDENRHGENGIFWNLIYMDEYDGKIFEIKRIFENGVDLEDVSWNFDLDWLDYPEKTLDEVAEGDILINKDGRERLVQEVRTITQVILRDSGMYISVNGLKNGGWSIKPQPDFIEITLDEMFEEVAKSRGVSVDKIKIKK